LEITLNKKNSTEGLIKIRLTEGDYQPRVEEKLKDYSRKANIKGFRQGKVPTGVVKKMFGKSILVDEINHLLSNKLSDYIKENKLRILGEPLPNQEKASGIDWDTQRDFEFEYQIGMVEDFTYDLSSNVKVQGYTITVDDKVMDETIADLKNRFGNMTYPEAAGAEDNLTGELRAKDGDFKKEYAFLQLDKVDKKEQARFVGVKKDEEVEFDVSKLFAEEGLTGQLLGIPAEEAKSAKGTYIFKVTNISHNEPAAVNTELFDRVFGPGVVTTEADFIQKVKETIAENYKRESEHFLDHHIEDYYLDNTKIEMPAEFLKNWLKSTSNGQVTDDVLAKEFDAYARGLKWDLVKNKIAEDKQITVESEEVRGKAKEMILAQFGGQQFAAQLGDRMDAIADNYLQSENGQNFMRLYNQLRGEKIMKLIRESITVQEKKVSADEFKKIVEEHKH
jgi:trigger factor